MSPKSSTRRPPRGKAGQKPAQPESQTPLDPELFARNMLEVGLRTQKALAEMARRTQDLRTRLEVRQIRSAPDRVLQFLRLRCDADGNWSPPGTLKQWAQELGLTHEALYRALATLEREGRIQRADRLLRLVTP